MIFGLGWGSIGLRPGPIFAQVGMGPVGALIALAGDLHGTWPFGAVRKHLPEWFPHRQSLTSLLPTLNLRPA